MLIALIPALIAIVGLLVYILSTTNPKSMEIGRILFLCGMLVVTLTLAHTTFRLP